MDRIVSLVLIFSVVGLYATVSIPTASAEIVTGYDIFMLAGQSNMYNGEEDTGDTFPDPDIDKTDKDVKQWGRFAPNDGEIIEASVPLEHATQPGDNTDWPLMFARAYKAQGYLAPGRKVLLIPVAVGNTGFSDNNWNEGNAEYTDAVNRTSAALAENPNNVLKAILWQQGEDDDDTTATANAHEANLEAMIAAMRSDLSATNTPVIAGGMVPAWVSGNANRETIQAGIESAMNDINRGYYVDPSSPTELVAPSICPCQHYEGESARGANPVLTDNSTMGLAGRYMEQYIAFENERASENSPVSRANRNNTVFSNLTLGNVTF